MLNLPVTAVEGEFHTDSKGVLWQWVRDRWIFVKETELDKEQNDD